VEGYRERRVTIDVANDRSAQGCIARTAREFQ
jgi:hypothetical protein